MSAKTFSEGFHMLQNFMRTLAGDSIVLIKISKLRPKVCSKENAELANTCIYMPQISQRLVANLVLKGWYESF
jgi:hypothetical protein